jgi:hypothetical protein
MSRLAQGLLIGTVLGIAMMLILVWSFRDDPPAPLTPAGASSTDGAAESDVAALQKAVARERRARERLEGEVAALTLRLEEFAFEYGIGDPAGGVSAPGGVGLGEPEDEARPGDSPAERVDDDPPRGDDEAPSADWFSADKLARLGYSPDEIARIRERWSESVMNELYLGDARARGEAKPGKKMRMLRGAINLELRADLGDESYDALLYATNQKNRVLITDVLDGSPASEAGIRPGDEVLSYDGNRIFNPFAFKAGTSRGELGEWVAVEVLRGGESYRLFARRGPLGVRLEHRVVSP